jgi:glutathione S-transferase
MLKVWGRRNSLNVQKVMWLVGELGLEHEHILAGGAYGGLDAPEYRARNPWGKIPAIEDDGVPVWESHAILRHLAERFGGPRFWPDVAARARITPWMDWSLSAWEPNFLGGLFWGFYRTPEPQRDLAAIKQAEQACAERMEFVDKILAGRPYLAGEELSLADFPLGACMFRYFTMGVATPEIPNVRTWYERLKNRPAYQAHVMVPFEDMKGRVTF